MYAIQWRTAVLLILIAAALGFSVGQRFKECEPLGEHWRLGGQQNRSTTRRRALIDEDSAVWGLRHAHGLKLGHYRLNAL